MPINREIFQPRFKRFRFMPIRPVFQDSPIPRASLESAHVGGGASIHYQMVIMHRLDPNAKSRYRGVDPDARIYFTQNVKDVYLLFLKITASFAGSSMVNSRHE
jgi:hypothetical protein